MLVLFITLASPVQQAVANAPFERVEVADAKARLERCGLGAVTSRYDRELQSDLLTPANPEYATDEQLACADKAVGYHLVELPTAVQARFDAIRTARLSPIWVADARRRLAAFGRAAPEYEKGVTSDLAFAGEVERRCGSSAIGAFGSAYGLHILSPAWLGRQVQIGDANDPAFACVTDMALVAGYELGFIGNQAMAVP